MFSNGERGGPLATYLVTSKARNNFKLWMNTTVKRVIRSGGHVTGVEVEAFGDGGYQGIVNVTQTTGRVVLSAGTFGTAKILFKSKIFAINKGTLAADSPC
jgi:cellobiose dehydrogenase (acceptor)